MLYIKEYGSSDSLSALTVVGIAALGVLPAPLTWKLDLLLKVFPQK